jgi:hypothetical protein
MFVTTWNSAIASRLIFGCPKLEPETRCVICWPSMFIWNWSSLTPGVLPTLLAVMPLTMSASSCQLRPCSGSSAIWRRSMLPATCARETSTSGACDVTVTVSCSDASFIMTFGRVTFWPTSSSTSVSSTDPNPSSS